MERLLVIVMCHLVGDYVLQTDYLAKTKGANWYHMLVHCLLYTLPFMAYFGVDGRLVCIFVAHLIIDTLKARWSVIGYSMDQIAHYVIATVLYLSNMMP